MKKTDLVVISVETYTAKRAYEIAKKLEKGNKSSCWRISPNC